ncbi:NAC domain-containing protein JA2L-like [Pistacia vera]|uniref:NAC domain-containing protein JA2L-like n=1 Tax=Pistacia vera TaxID=55513 RepID=UPI001263E370|nr:NAC domain-containing protein JA2L-like [Pistacia vera]
MDCLPLCFRFDPTDEEIIFYLYHKVYGLQLPSNAVIDCDVYHESHVWKKLLEERREDRLYVFTKLDKKIGRSKVGRVTESGTWRSQHDKDVYMSVDGGEKKQHVGYKKSFTFVPKEKNEEKRKWVMHEYRLHESLVPANINPFDLYVLCRIKKTGTKEEPKKNTNGRKFLANNNTSAVPSDQSNSTFAKELEAVLMADD